MKLAIVATILFVATVCYGHGYGGYGGVIGLGGGFLGRLGGGFAGGIVRVAASPVVAVDGLGYGGYGYGRGIGGYGVRYGGGYGGYGKY